MGYVFDPDQLHEIARKGIGLSHAEMSRVVGSEPPRAYPSQVRPAADWLFNLAGGAVGAMTVLHGSLTEYVLIFGSPIGVHGYSGRYRIEIFDFMMAGEMWTYTEDR